ncbi:MAG: EamA family transporter [Bacillota bacterium]|jgi:uncharacterized membrane protein
MAYVFAVLSAFGMGLNDLCIQMGMRSGRVNSSQALIINLISGNIFLLVLAAIEFFSKGFPNINYIGLVFFIASGISAPFLARLLCYLAIDSIGATRAGSLRVSDTFFTMIIAFFLFSDVIMLRSFFGSIILVTGIAILIYEMDNKRSDSEIAFTGKQDKVNRLENKENLFKRFSSSGLYFGSFLAITSGLLFAFGGIFREMGIEQIPSAILGSLISSMIALMANAIYLYITGQMGRSWNMSLRSTAFFALGGIGNSFGILAFFLALSGGVTVSVATALKNTSPVFTLCLAWLALRKIERITVKLVGAIVMIVIGSTIIIL